MKARYQGLEAGLRQLQSSLDLALKRVDELNQGAGTDVDVEAYDEELDALLAQTSREIDAVSSKDSRPADLGSELTSGAELHARLGSFTPPSSLNANNFSIPSLVRAGLASFRFSKPETIELIEHFRFEGERFPFIQFDDRFNRLKSGVKGFVGRFPLTGRATGRL
ncbi:hypothetical protein BDZ45DRAFT_417924 [Acephala macrosclerotiorum]|nr:hypothetical protein BDZ45DRAFT_417924 [Acephala macrosclerotiorum]